MAKTSWETALVRKLMESKFTGELTLGFDNGNVTGHNVVADSVKAPVVRTRRARTPKVVKETAMTAGS